MLRVVGTAIVTAILTSAFWIFYFGIAGAPTADSKVTASGQKVIACRILPKSNSSFTRFNMSPCAKAKTRAPLPAARQTNSPKPSPRHSRNSGQWSVVGGQLKTKE